VQTTHWANLAGQLLLESRRRITYQQPRAKTWRFQFRGSRQREAEAYAGPEGVARCDFGEGHGVAEHCQDRSNAYARPRVSDALN